MNLLHRNIQTGMAALQFALINAETFLSLLALLAPNVIFSTSKPMNSRVNEETKVVYFLEAIFSL